MVATEVVPVVPVRETRQFITGLLQQLHYLFVCSAVSCSLFVIFLNDNVNSQQRY